MTVTIRIIRDLHRWLVALAKKNNRSLNGQIEFMLKQCREAEEHKK